MSFRIYGVFITVLLFSGCSNEQQTSVAQSQSDLPMYVRNTDLSDYWLVQNSNFSFELPNAHLPMQNGEVEVGFIINVNGHTSNFEIVRSNPEGLWDEHALAGAKQLVFLSEPNNTPVKDIYTTWQFEFKAAQKQ